MMELRRLWRALSYDPQIEYQRAKDQGPAVMIRIGPAAVVRSRWLLRRSAD
jgi:hypothetical protein